MILDAVLPMYMKARMNRKLLAGGKTSAGIFQV